MRNKGGKKPTYKKEREKGEGEGEGEGEGDLQQSSGSEVLSTPVQ